MTIASATPPVLTGVRDWISGFDIVLCDIWGVLHDGLVAHAGAADALIRFRAGGGTVVLVSNAPRPAAAVVPHLDQLGVPRAAWDGIVTSGDVTRSLIDAEPDKPYGWLGPERDAPLFEGLASRRGAIETSPRLVCTGLVDDERETLDDYRALLAGLRDRDVTFVCANPDLVVERGGTLVLCAGALAEAYEAIGGRAVYAGKPYRPVYDAALAVAGAIRKATPELARVAAIGDALRTDVAGARMLGCASLLVARGIHTHELGIADRPLDTAALEVLLTGAAVAPDAAIDRLTW
jgi:hypothetical protein